MKKSAKSLHSLLWGILLACTAVVGYAADLSKPLVLVATDRLDGSPYEETVVLVVPSGDGQHLGLIANRPTNINLAQVLPNAPAAQSVTEPLFFGGPAMSDSLFAAIRTQEPPSSYSISLLPGLFLVTDEEGVNQVIKTAPNEARYFTGFIVWAEDELEAQIKGGLWDAKFADVNVLFRSDPQGLWPELARAKGEVAILK